MFENIQNQLKQKYVNTEWQWNVQHNKAQKNSRSKITDIKKRGNIHTAVFDNGEVLNVEMLSDFVTPLTEGVPVPPKNNNNAGIDVPPHLKNSGGDRYGAPSKTVNENSAPPGSMAIEDMNNMQGGMGTMGSGGTFESSEKLKYPSMRRLNANGPINKRAPSIMSGEYSEDGHAKNIEKHLNDFKSDGENPQTRSAGFSQNVRSMQKPSELFSMFDTSDREVNIKLKLELPEMKLLKMMYKSAADGDEFVDNLTKYVMQNISEEDVAEAVAKLMGGTRKKDNVVEEQTGQPEFEDKKEVLEISEDFHIVEPSDETCAEVEAESAEQAEKKEDNDENRQD